jgi:hypothetical protein
MALYALYYRYIDDPATVSTYRPKHREYLTTLVERGELLASGPLGDPGPAGGLLIFEVESLDRMEEIIREDPFTHHGVIEDLSIQSWSLFIGADLFETKA